MKSKMIQKGEVSAMLMGLIVVVVALLLFVFIGVGSYVSANNSAAKYESTIDARYKNNEQVLSSCTVSIRNIAKIPEQYANQLKDVIRTEMEGRYGTGERVAIFVQERALNFTPDMYNKVMNEVISCENKFSNGQQAMLDMLSQYEIARNSVWTGTFMKIAGYPKKDLSKFKTIVDKSAKDQFESGVRKDYELTK